MHPQTKLAFYKAKPINRQAAKMVRYPTTDSRRLPCPFCSKRKVGLTSHIKAVHREEWKKHLAEKRLSAGSGKARPASRQSASSQGVKKNRKKSPSRSRTRVGYSYEASLCRRNYHAMTRQFLDSRPD